MGPNSKQRSRKQYVKYRLKVLTELHIPHPTQDVIDKMLDENLSEIRVDAMFHSIIARYNDNELR